MSDRGEINSHHPPMPELARLCAEHAALGIATVSLTASAVALTIEVLTAVAVHLGVYAILGSLFGAGFVGWIVGTAERRVRRDLGGAVAGLTKEITNLHEQVQRQRVIYLPAPGQQAGNMYASAAAGQTAAPKPDGKTAIDPEELREQVEQVVAEELGTRESVRSQGYAEGYVDGVARRSGQADPSD